MKLNKFLLSAFALGVFSMATLVSCDDDSATENQLNPNYVSLMDTPVALEILQGETGTTQGKIYASQATGSDRVVELKVLTADDTDMMPYTTIAAGDYTVPATVTIPAGATEASFPITITGNDLGYSGKQLVIAIVPKAGIDIAMSYDTPNAEVVSKRAVITAKRACDQNLLSITISSDAYGSETTWELYDVDFNLVASGGPYEDEVGSGETRSTCLEDGNYTFVIYDSYGDGMVSASSQGSYTLSKRDANGAQVQIATGGEFADYEIVEFSLP